MADTPEQIKQHSDKYKNGSWEDYTPEQLAHWVINMGIRATHRSNREKARKDIEDARTYLSMLEAWLEEREDESYA